MAMGALGKLVTEPLLAVGTLSGYDLPAEPPDLAFVPHAEPEAE